MGGERTVTVTRPAQTEGLLLPHATTRKFRERKGRKKIVGQRVRLTGLRAFRLRMFALHVFHTSVCAFLNLSLPLLTGEVQRERTRCGLRVNAANVQAYCVSVTVSPPLQGRPPDPRWVPEAAEGRAPHRKHTPLSPAHTPLRRTAPLCQSLLSGPGSALKIGAT